MENLLKSVCRDLGYFLKQTKFNNIYLFGSLVHKNGAQFDLQQSDIDTICPFKSGYTYLDRWKAVRIAEDPTSHLNLQLLRVLKRKDASDPIVSVVPVSTLELEFGIHKDKSPQFFSHNTFLNISNDQTCSIGKEYKPSSPKLEGALDAVRETQRFRNKILAISPLGICAINAYEGPDVLPKVLLRCAAQVRWAGEKNISPEQRFDVNEGLIYVLQLLVARRNESSNVDDVLQRVIIRMGGRGEPAPLTPFDQLLLWEILTAESFGLVPKDDEPVKPIPRTGISKKIKDAAFRRSGYCCSFPGCNVPLGDDGIGEISHIQSLSKSGARYNPDLNEDKLKNIENLVVLCPIHHRLIDSKPEEYTTKVIQSWNKSLTKVGGIEIPFSSKDLFTIARIISNLIS